MASRDQGQDEFAGSNSVPQLERDNGLELLQPDYVGNNNPISFPFLPVAGNLYGYEQNFRSAAVNDLNMVIDVDGHDRNLMNIPFDPDIFVRNDMPSLNDQAFNFYSGKGDTMSSGYQTPNDMMTAYRGMSSAPHFENIPGRINRNSIATHNFGVGNFHSSVLDAETQNNSRQLTDISKSSVNFFGFAPKVEQSTDSRVYDNQVKVTSFQPNSSNKLDGGFLSLGNQGSVGPYVNSSIYNEKASEMSEISFSPQSHLGNNSFDNLRGSLAGFHNDVGGLATPSDCASSLTLTGDEYYNLQAMTSGHDMSQISSLHGEQANVHHYVPTPSYRTPDSRWESSSRKSSGDPFGCSVANPHMLSDMSGYKQGSDEYLRRRTKRLPFNSSVLKSNHQNAVSPPQNPNLRTNLMLPSSGVIIEGSASQDKLGLGDDITVNIELPRASTAVKRGSLKRRLDVAPRDSIQDQRRKIMPQTSAQHFSPDLVQNALGKFATSYSMPVNTASTSSSIIPNALRKDSAANGRARRPRNTSFSPAAGTVGASNAARVSQHLAASASAFVSPIGIPATSSAFEGNSLAVPSSSVGASLANISGIPVAVAENPIFMSLPMDAPPIALARTTAQCFSSPRIPIRATSSKRVVAAALSPSARSPASTTAPRKTHSLHTSSAMACAALSDWKKSLPPLAALAKASPGFRASQVPNSIPHIKWQDPAAETPPIMGSKCMLCKRDLTFTPEGPILQPPIPPAVAVLSCGHTFHDHCMQLITPEDQSKDPPCIPCAMGEK